VTLVLLAAFPVGTILYTLGQIIHDLNPRRRLPRRG
jgi:hypothetical protein